MSTGGGARKSRLKKLRKGLGRFQAGASNALELLQRGRLTAPYRASFEVAAEGPHHKLRHYHGELAEGAQPVAEPLLLIPPLMVTSEIYDISPELSAVSWLTHQGVDVWVVDFGAPEQAEGGLERTLGDHIKAIDASISHIKAHVGTPVHLAGYSQGGMFAYQAAAWRRGRDVGSIVTFGSPVNIWRNLPVKVHDDLAERFLMAAREAIDGPLAQLPGLPGALTSGGFKVFSAGKEVRQVIELFGLLHDREALERREPKRRFLGGEGFVSWPGPAFREFVDQVVVQNRMSSGGFVIDGRTVTLADLSCPILYFVGLRDDLARPPAVRAIVKAAPQAQHHEQAIAAGHFGLVVGSRAMTEVWPTVEAWLRWRSGQAERPPQLDEGGQRPRPQPSPEGEGAQTGFLYDMATEVIDSLWDRLGEVPQELSSVIDTVRWQLPRLTRLENLRDTSRVSMGRALADQARSIPDAPFFLWRGRAFSYKEADERVNQLAHALLAQGLLRGGRVGIFMDNHPDLLTALVALNRMGVVAVLLNAGLAGDSLSQALEAGGVQALIVDPPRATSARLAMDEGAVWALAVEGAALPEGVTDLEATLDPHATEPPAGADTGLGADLAMLLFTSGTSGMPKAARITNMRWAAAALASAAACRLTARDTVYCCLPLHHATGLLVAVGGALVGGARLALAPRFSTTTFWDEVHRHGVTVVFYVGELCRYLVQAPQGPAGRHPIRLFVGNGMRPGVWQRLQERFGPTRVLEFYSATEGNVALVNFTGDKIGSVGAPLGQGDRVALVRWDAEAGDLLRDDRGRPIPCQTDEPGMLLGRIDLKHPLGRFEGYERAEDTEARVRRDLFAPGDAWFITGDLLRRDADGDFWFIDRVGDTFRWKGENVSTEQVAEVLHQHPGVALAAVYGVALPWRDGRAGMAALELAPDADLNGPALFALVEEHLFPAARPRFLRVVQKLETTASLKVIKQRLQDEGADPTQVTDPIFWYDEQGRTYAPLDAETYGRLTAP